MALDRRMVRYRASLSLLDHVIDKRCDEGPYGGCPPGALLSYDFSMDDIVLMFYGREIKEDQSNPCAFCLTQEGDKFTDKMVY